MVRLSLRNIEHGIVLFKLLTPKVFMRAGILRKNATNNYGPLVITVTNEQYPHQSPLNNLTKLTLGDLFNCYALNKGEKYNV